MRVSTRVESCSVLASYPCDSLLSYLKISRFPSNYPEELNVAKIVGIFHITETEFIESYGLLLEFYKCNR